MYHHLLGNTKGRANHGLVNSATGQPIAPVSYGGGEGEYAHSLLDMKREIKESAYQALRTKIAKLAAQANELCLNSVVYVPDIRCLANFSNLDDLVSSEFKEYTVFAVKNPIAFGYMVYADTYDFAYNINLNINCAEPSQFVGIAYYETPLLDEDNIHFNMQDNYIAKYLKMNDDLYASVERKLRYVNGFIDQMANQAFMFSQNKGIKIADGFNTKVAVFLDTYHKSIKPNVSKGLTATIVEDSYLNIVSSNANDFRSNIIKLYNYAEKNALTYENAYPSYDKEVAYEEMIEQKKQLSEFESAVCSELYELLKFESIDIGGNEYANAAYVIATNRYLSLINEDLTKLVSNLKGI